jgi:hypothetical protein
MLESLGCVQAQCFDVLLDLHRQLSCRCENQRTESPLNLREKRKHDEGWTQATKRMSSKEKTRHETRKQDIACIYSGAVKQDTCSKTRKQDIIRTDSGLRSWAVAIRCTIGMPNAKVLPLPVSLAAMTSRQSRMAGSRQASWMGDGLSNLRILCQHLVLMA